MKKELFVKAEEIAEELGFSKPYAYKLVREMNEELKKKISALQAEIEEEEKSKHSAASFLRSVKRYTDIQELTLTILNELVEEIVVYQAEGVGKGRTQRLEVHYNFVGTLDTPEVACLPQSVTIDTRQGVAVEYITRKIE